jgi:hypothetical protein
MLDTVLKSSEFVPEGPDVSMVEKLLLLHVIDLFIFKFFLGFAQSNYMVILLQFMFSVPLLCLCIYLYIRFKYYFSASSFQNLKIICMFMMAENAINSILRFIVGLKILLSFSSGILSAILNFILPIVFECFWVHIYSEYAQNKEYMSKCYNAS